MDQRIALTSPSDGGRRRRYYRANCKHPPLAHEDGSGNVTWLLADQNGSVQDVINTSGAITDRVIFNAFGQKELADTGTPSLYGFEGMMQGVASTPSGIFALDYDNARWYDPNSEDFISQDPKGVKGSGSNLYEFVGDDPVINTDPTGMMFLTGIAQEAYPNSLYSTSSVLSQEAQTLTSES